MITYNFFEDQIKQLYDAHGKKTNPAQIAEFYAECRETDEGTIKKVIKQLKRNLDKFPPLSTFLQTIATLTERTGELKSKRNGKPCSNPECSLGLIIYYRNVKGTLYRFVSRCPYCKSYDAPFIPFYDKRMEEYQESI